jgi:trimethylamine-N-oxide reductase (cytochrome c)
VLSPGRLIGDMVPGMAPQLNADGYPQVRRKAAQGQLFEDKLDKVNLEAEPGTATCVEIIEGHGFEKLQAIARQNYLKKGAAAK